ncbi:hypothetical protein MKX03_005500, partial [Papaver bracteatum]
VVETNLVKKSKCEKYFSRIAAIENDIWPQKQNKALGYLNIRRVMVSGFHSFKVVFEHLFYPN